MKQMIVSKIPYGETFRVFGDTFVALDRVDGGVLAIRRDIWKNAPFDKDGKNNLKGSSIHKELCEYLSILMENGANADGVIKTTVDLKATDSTREYGFFRMWAALLTLEQYGKYQYIIPHAEDEWWLATPHMAPGQENGGSKFVWYVGFNGTSYRKPFCVHGIRPALVFAPSLLVEYDDSEEEPDDADGEREKAIYYWYLRYVFDLANFNSNNIGESPLSYEEWKRHNKES